MMAKYFKNQTYFSHNAQASVKNGVGATDGGTWPWDWKNYKKMSTKFNPLHTFLVQSNDKTLKIHQSVCSRSSQHSLQGSQARNTCHGSWQSWSQKKAIIQSLRQVAKVITYLIKLTMYMLKIHLIPMMIR